MITEEQLTYQELKRISKNPIYTCGKCGSRLTLCWHENQFILKCSRDIEHDTLNSHIIKSPNEIEGEIIFRRNKGMDTTALTTMDESKMLARIDMVKFPQDLRPEDRKALALAAISYGFDPLMGEISIYQGKPFISIDGRYRKAQETNNLGGVESRPATKEEKTDWDIPEGDYFFRADVYVKGVDKPFIGWGRVRAVETKPRPDKPGDNYKPIVNNPQRMAEKRAEAQALRKAFHIPLPSIEDIGTQEVELVAPVIEEVESTNKIDMAWLKENLEAIPWKGKELRDYFEDTLEVDGSGTIAEVVERLNPQQQAAFVGEVQQRLVYGQPV